VGLSSIPIVHHLRWKKEHSPIMANIGPMPSGKELAEKATRLRTGSYGPHLTYSTIPGESATLRIPASGDVLAIVRVAGRFEVDLSEVSEITVPYVSKFLRGTGYEVLKNWRTGEYRFKRTAAKANGSAVATTANPVAAKAPTATVAHAASQPKAATITIAPATEPSAPASATIIDPIAGMIYASSTRTKDKSAGRGWTLVNGHIVASNDDVETLERAWSLRTKGKPGTVLLTGPSGTAKSELVQAWAESRGIDFLKVDCGAVKSVDDWSIHLVQDPQTKVWARHWSPFAQALRAGKPCVINLDELSRTETAGALNALLGLLDRSGTLLVSEMNTVLSMPDGIMVVATANIGPEFVGTLPIDGAVRSRFTYGVRTTFLPEEQEAKLLMSRSGQDRVAGISRETADALVRMAAQQRIQRDDAEHFPSGNVINTRTLLGIAESIADGREARSAIWSVLKGQFDPGDDKALTVLVDTQFPKRPEPVAPVKPTPASITVGQHWFHGSGTGCEFVATGTYMQCGMPLASPIHFGNKTP
jgi:MoxR-like ATPase